MRWGIRLGIWLVRGNWWGITLVVMVATIKTIRTITKTIIIIDWINHWYQYWASLKVIRIANFMANRVRYLIGGIIIVKIDELLIRKMMLIFIYLYLKFIEKSFIYLFNLFIVQNNQFIYLFCHSHHIYTVSFKYIKRLFPITLLLVFVTFLHTAYTFINGFMLYLDS